MREIVVTREGLARLERELEQLRTVRRREVGERIKDALETGTDSAENSEFLAAKEEQALLERRVAQVEERLAHARLVAAADFPPDTVGVGSRVRLTDVETQETEEFEIVGSSEGNPSKGRISSGSPVASAILGHRKDDIVDVDVPHGRRRLKILQVRDA